MTVSTSDSSAILALPYLQPSQAQKHVTHNEALRILDTLVQLVVEGFGAETPPAVPAEGEVHALGAAPTGAWAGQAGTIATWAEGVWSFVAPRAGWRAWGRAEAELRVWDGAGWVLPRAETDNLSGLGIGTASDPVNRLAVKSEAVLLSHDGADHRLTINKAADTDTASLLFQSGWTGHAELGLAGDTEFSLKVSPDGAAWTEALRVTGDAKVGIGAAAPQALCHVKGADSTLGTFDGTLVVEDADASVELVTDTGGMCHVYFADGNTRPSPAGGGGAIHYAAPGSGGTAEYMAFDVKGSEAARIDKNGNIGIGTSSPTEALDVNSDAIRIRTSQTPASAGASGTKGQICWDGDYIYVCVAANTWKRAALATW